MNRGLIFCCRRRRDARLRRAVARPARRRRAASPPAPRRSRARRSIIMNCRWSRRGSSASRSPRRMILSGPADDFQRSELVRIMDQVPGVHDGPLGPRLAAAGGALMTLPLDRRGRAARAGRLRARAVADLSARTAPPRAPLRPPLVRRETTLIELWNAYWPVILVGLLIGLIVGYLVFRPRQRVTLSSDTPVRPHMTVAAAPPPRRGRRASPTKPPRPPATSPARSSAPTSAPNCPARDGAARRSADAEGRRAQARGDAQRARHHPLRPDRQPVAGPGRGARCRAWRLPRPPRPATASSSRRTISPAATSTATRQKFGKL